MTHIKNWATYLGAKIGNIMSGKNGSYELIAVPILIIITLVVAAVIFGPSIFKYFLG